LCQSHERTSLFTGTDRLCGVPGRFAYWTCASCRTVYQDPRIRSSALSLCYPGNYYIRSDATAESPTSRRRFATLRDGVRSLVREAVEGRRRPGPVGWIAAALRLSESLRAQAYWGLLDELLPWHRPPDRALDGGCGAGEMLQGLARGGWKAFGLDPDGIAVASARSRSGRPVVVGDFRRAPFQPGSFGLILLSHSFEHLPKPDEVLERIAELLVPDGRCVLIYPNTASLGARWFGEAWQGWDPPRHLVLPSARGMRLAAARAGLELRALRTMTRWPEGGFALSRAWRRGAFAATPAASDRWAARVSRYAASLGLPVGEEVIVTLAKPRPNHTR
jgi:SAM-dependent methyltransferase